MTRLWCVKGNPKDGEIYLRADAVEISLHGELAFYSSALTQVTKDQHKMTQANGDHSPDDPSFPLTSQQKADELLRRWWHPSRKAPARRRGREMSSELLPEEVLKDLLGEEGFEIADTKAAAHAILQRLTDAGFVVVAKSSLVTHRRGWGNCRRQSRKAPGLGRGLSIYLPRKTCTI